MHEQYDVVILGGGMAGLTLSLQLKKAKPDISILLLERRETEATTAAHKVGESTVELGTHYLREVLDIKGYLEELKVSRAEDGNLATMLGGALHLGRTEVYYAEQERRIAKLTVEQVNAALRAHLAPNRLVIIRAGDFKKKADPPKK